MKKIRPICHTIVVEPIEVTEKSAGGIIIATPEIKKLEQQAQIRGKVLAMGADAYSDMLDKSVKVGDIVYYQRHAGSRPTDEFGNIRFDRLLLKDLDIVAVEEDE